MVSPTPPLPAQKYEYSTYSTSASMSPPASRFAAIMSAAMTLDTPGYTPAVVMHGTPAARAAACLDLAACA
jgi:hypothetical protein